jgi:etoposide-induced 2.4 mRNA
MTLKQCLSQFINGFKDSIVGFIRFFKKQKLLAAAIKSKTESTQQTNKIKKSSNKLSNHEKLYQRLFQSCILNGIFLLSCILMFNFLLMPLLNMIAYKLLSDNYHNMVTNYINPLIHLLFSFVWIVPVFLLSKVFNLLCHQEIADIAYMQKYGKPSIYQKFSPAEIIADTVFSCTMELIFLVQGSIMNLVPISFLSQCLVHVHLAFLYSLYSFEYKLCNMSWTIKDRISYIESRWPYYLGFGMSLSLIVSMAGSYIYSATLFASIFPAFIISAIEADPEKLSPIVYYKQEQNKYKPVILSIPLFRFSLFLTDLIFKVFANRQKQKQQKTSQQQKKSSNYPSQATITLRKTN